MSIIEQVEQLKTDWPLRNGKDNSLESALNEYHKMVESGVLKPRENQLQQTYTAISFHSNCL